MEKNSPNLKKTPPCLYSGQITDLHYISSKVMEVTIKHSTPESMHFRPGQFVSLKVSDKDFRSYSIASDYKDTESFKLIVSVDHEGLGSNFVKSLKVGDVVNYIGPSGRFFMKEPTSENVYFISVGTGLAPFIPMIFKLIDDGIKGQIKIIQGFRTISDIFYAEMLSNMAKSYSTIEYRVYISQPESTWQFVGRTTDYLAGLDPSVYSTSDFYLCGQTHMVASCAEILESKNVSKDRILFEEYTPAVKPVC